MSKLLGLLKKSIKKIGKGLISGTFISFAVLVMICFGIWILGPRLGFGGNYPLRPEVARVIAMLVAAVIWSLYTAIRLSMKLSRANKPAPAEPEIVQEVISSPEKVFESAFRKAMRTIERNWVGTKNKRGSRGDVLNALPWYVVLGFPNAGKTSLIVESDLQFPLAHLFSQENAKIVQPTEYVDYWVTDEAIVFDVAGQLLVKETDERGREDLAIWKRFHKLLNEFRPRRPINGVILAVDVLDLMYASEEQRAEKASILHARLVELSAALSTRYTLHVALTKFDLLDGFNIFFSNTNKAELVEPFGFSFDLYKQEDGNVWLENFDEQFQKFLARLNEMMVDKLHQHRLPDERRQVYSFVRQVAGLNEILTEFLGRALSQDKFSMAPQVRGVYTLSSRQEGVPADAMMSAISSKYELAPPIMSAHSTYSKPVFVNRFLRGAVFAEAGLAGDNVRAMRSKRGAFYGSALAASLLLGAVSYYWWGAYQSNVEMANLVVQETLTADGRPVAGAEQVGDSHLPSLNALSAARVIYGDHERVPAVVGAATLYQGRKMNPRVDRAYIDMLDQKFLPEVAVFLEDYIADLGDSPDTRDSNERLEALRVYLKLGDQEKRIDPDNRQPDGEVNDWFGKVWQERFTGNEQLQKSLMDHLEFALNMQSMEAPINASLVSEAQADLENLSNDMRLYQNIASLAERQLSDDISIINVVGPSFTRVFSSGEEGDLTANPNWTVDAFFTKRNFLEFFVPHNNSLSTIAVSDAWVVGARQDVQYSEEDVEAFQRRVAATYAKYYADSWQDLINSLDVSDFKNLSHGVGILEELTGPNAPIERMLNSIKQNTEIYEIEAIELTEEQALDADQPFDIHREQGMRIRRAFSDLNAVVTPDEEGKAPVEDYLVALDNLYQYLKEIEGAGSKGGELALVRAKDRLALKGTDPIYTIQRLSAELPQPLNRMFEKLADQSWKVLLEASKQELQREWDETIFSVFAADFLPHYPFSTNSNSDVALSSFKEFFGPGGEVESFYDNNLKVFLNDATKQPKEIDGRFLDISSTFVDQMEYALNLSEEYFDSSGELHFEYSIKPRSLSNGMGRSVISLDGQLVPYKHGPKRPINILWPNVATATGESKITLFPRNGRSRSMTFDGPWSSFRLFDQALRSDLSNSSTDLTFNVGGSTMRYEVMVRGPTNIFSQRPLSSLMLPSAL